MRKRIVHYLSEILTFNVLAGYIWHCNTASLYFLSSGKKLLDKQKKDQENTESPQETDKSP